MKTRKNNLYLLVGGNHDITGLERGRKEKVTYFRHFSSRKNNSSYNIVLIDGNKEDFAEILTSQTQSELVKLLRMLVGAGNTGEKISDSLISFVKREYGIKISPDNCLLLNVPKVIDGVVEYHKIEHA